ncbi:MAG: cystathionine gamma-synthase [Actinobacteria bacterium]|nr:cystathionine gamma-synthase [Actinomycetota bacterium]
MVDSTSRAWSTKAVAAGRPARIPDSPLNAPIVPASSFYAGGVMEYAREAAPTSEALETALAALESGRHAVVYSSGMAAANALMDLIPPGGSVVASSATYTGVRVRLEELHGRGTIRLTQVGIDDTDAVFAALDAASTIAGTPTLWLESPTNPLLEVADLPAILDHARSVGARSVIDNTFATPARQRPLELGADAVLHSVTKAISGHSDLLLGAVVVSDDDMAEALRTRRVLLGAAPSAFDSFLALRGLRTLAIRMDRAEASAQELVTRLRNAPGISRIRYPGWGSLIAIEVDSPPDVIDAMCARAEVWTYATSLGGVESLIERRRRWPLESVGVPENLVRLSVGIEDVDDLWTDLSTILSTR